MPVWLEYNPKNTVIHRLHPITKIIFFGSLTVLAGFYWDLRYMAPLALIAVLLAYISKVPKSWFLPLGVILLGATPFNMIMSIVQTNPELFRVIPRDIAGEYLFQFQLPLLGSKIGLTIGGAFWGTAAIFRLAILVILVYTFISTTSISELIAGLSKIKVPMSLLYVFMVAYKLVPHLFRTVWAILSAQRLRGWEIGTKNPIKIFKRLAPVTYPIIFRTMAIIDEVNIASQIRAFGSTKTSFSIKILRFRAVDIIISVLSLSILAICLYYLFIFGYGLI